MLYLYSRDLYLLAFLVPFSELLSSRPLIETSRRNYDFTYSWFYFVFWQ